MRSAGLWSAAPDSTEKSCGFRPARRVIVPGDASIQQQCGRRTLRGLSHFLSAQSWEVGPPRAPTSGGWSSGRGRGPWWLSPSLLRPVSDQGSEETLWFP